MEREGELGLTGVEGEGEVGIDRMGEAGECDKHGGVGWEGEWGGRGSVDRHEWEGRRRAGTDSGVGGGESGDRQEERRGAMGRD